MVKVYIMESVHTCIRRLRDFIYRSKLKIPIDPPEVVFLRLSSLLLMSNVHVLSTWVSILSNFQFYYLLVILCFAGM